MKERRPLIAGLTSSEGVDPTIEKDFVFGAKAPPAESIANEDREGKGPTTGVIRREPLTTRIRSDYAKALKRASLERQLAGMFPNTMLEILEEALEPWLRANGYLK